MPHADVSGAQRRSDEPGPAPESASAAATGKKRRQAPSANVELDAHTPSHAISLRHKQVHDGSSKLSAGSSGGRTELRTRQPRISSAAIDVATQDGTRKKRKKTAVQPETETKADTKALADPKADESCHSENSSAASDLERTIFVGNAPLSGSQDKLKKALKAHFSR